MNVTIKIDNQHFEIESGLVNAETIYALIECEGRVLYLNRKDDRDIPLAHSDLIIVQREVTFVTGDQAQENNPALRNPISFRFNGNSGQTASKPKLTGKQLKQLDDEVNVGRLFADIDNAPDAELDDSMSILVQEKDAFFIIPAGEDNEFGAPIDVEQCIRHRRRPPKGQRSYRIKIDGDKIRVDARKSLNDNGEISGTEILKLVDKEPQDWALNQKLKGGQRIRVKPEELVNIAEPGVERFETVRRQAQQGSV